MSEYDYENEATYENENENEVEYGYDNQDENQYEYENTQDAEEYAQENENRYVDNSYDQPRQYAQYAQNGQEEQVQEAAQESEPESEDEGKASAPMGGLFGMFGNRGAAGGSQPSSSGWLGGLASGMRGLSVKNEQSQEHGTRVAGGGGYAGSYAPPVGAPRSGSAGQTAQEFEYSRCTGRHRAVLVGINYTGTKGQLNGCINDVHNVTRFLQSRGYQDITILTDDTNNPELMPTRANIAMWMQRLVAGAQRDDALFFHYSGHGIQADGGDHTEADGKVEAICPVDYESAGLLIDRDSDYDILVKPLPAGCRLTAVFDSCHSGTVMNLPYIYSTQGVVKEPSMLLDTGKGLLRAAPQYLSGDTMGAAKSLFGAAMSSFKESKADDALRAQNTSPADVILFSGCKDDQTSADTTEEGQATGAMSYALIKSLNKNSNVTYKELLNAVRAEMRAGKYTQKPQLSSCHPIDTDLQFIIG